MKKQINHRKAAVGVACAAIVAVALGFLLHGTGNAGSESSYEDLLEEIGVPSSISEAVSSSSSESDDTSSVSSTSEQAGESASLSEETLPASESESENSVSEETAASSEQTAKSEPNASTSKAASEAVSSSAHASSVVSSSVSSSVSSAVSGSSHAVSSEAVSSSMTADEECDAKLAEYIHQIEDLQKRSEKKLYSILQDAWDEYMAHSAEERNLVLKVSVVLSKTGELTSAQNECDKEFNAIIKEMRQTLADYGRDSSLADDAEKTYKQKKNEMYNELVSQAYSGGDGSGQSGAWLAEHAASVE